MDQRLQSERVRAYLQRETWLATLICAGRVDSTMDLARAALAEPSQATPLLISAEEQLQGRGRSGRAWQAPPHSSLLFSLALREPTRDPAALIGLIWALAVAICEALEPWGISARLKWPNDLVVQHQGQWHKAAGMLLESRLEGGRVAWAILGCGINVAACPPPSPEMRLPPIALNTLSHGPIARDHLLAAIVDRFAISHDALRSGEMASLFSAWRARLMTLGERVAIMRSNETLLGVAEDLLPNGNLILRRDDGTTVVISSGDVGVV